MPLGNVVKKCGVEFGTSGCDEYDYLRNCIYATHGYRFRKARWRERFASTDWYKPDPKFDDSMISNIGMRNVRDLKDRVAACRAGETRELTGAVLAELSVDLDGDGRPEKIRATARAIDVGGQISGHGIVVEDPAAFHARAIDIDKGDQRREILLTTTEYENLIEHVVVWLARGQVHISESFVTGDLKVPGDGKLTTSDTNCGQTSRDTYAIQGSRLAKIASRTTGKHDPSMCAACPFVYVETEGGWDFRGEILRDVRSAAAAATRTMALGRATGETLRIKIAERKPEVTFLDAVAVRAGDEVIRPRRCRAANGPLCAADGETLRLERGDEVVLELDVPAGAELVLLATGYYVPD
jgi:hypothetical protein